MDSIFGTFGFILIIFGLPLTVVGVGFIETLGVIFLVIGGISFTIEIFFGTEIGDKLLERRIRRKYPYLYK